MSERLPVLTSETSPIRLDRVVDVPDVPGWLALTIAPGKKTLGSGVRWERDMDLDLDRLVELGATTLAPLVTDRELHWLQIPRLVTAARARGLTVLRFPFHDGGTPESMPETVTFVDALCGRLAQGDNVVVHCNGGLGRAGTIGACVRLRLGLDPDAPRAIQSIRAFRSNAAIETHDQERFIAAFARAHAPRVTSRG